MVASDIEIQADPEDYRSEGYLDEERRASYDVQERLVLGGTDPVLEIGIGPGLLADRLVDRGLTVVTADLDPRLDPEVACSITKLPFANDAFPTVAAFEVLEHLPRDRLDQAVAELCRVAEQRVLVSVPEKEDKWATYVSVLVLGRDWESSGHHWELGLYVSKLAFLRTFARVGFGLAGYDGSDDWHRFFVFTPDGVQPLPGRVAMLRDRWRMDDVLGNPEEKN